MKTPLLACAISVLALAANHAFAAEPLKAEVMHYWTSASEAAAVREIAKAYEAAGGTWQDNAVAGGEVAIPAEISRVVGGNPPIAMQMPLGPGPYDLAEAGLLANFDDLAAQDNFEKTIPKAYLEVMSYKGHFYELPVNVHGQNWLWYNPVQFWANKSMTADQFATSYAKIIEDETTRR